MAKSAKLLVALSEEEKAKLKEEAKKRQTSMTQLVRDAVEAYCDPMFGRALPEPSEERETPLEPVVAGPETGVVSGADHRVHVTGNRPSIKNRLESYKEL